jgi:predicted dehydrogenase
VAVADVDMDVANAVAQRFGLRAYSDPIEMMDNEDLEAVTIGTPPKTHASLATEAAARGLHIFLEKPLAPTIAECDTIIETAAAAGVVLMLGFKKRYAPAYAFLKEQEQVWGQPRIALCRYQLGPFDKDWVWAENDGGGPVIENTSHCLDLLRYLFGEPRTVFAETSNFFTKHRDSDVSEVVFTIRFESGATAAVAAGAAGIWADDESERITLSFDAANVDVSGPFDSPRTMRIMERDGVGPSIRSWGAMRAGSVTSSRLSSNAFEAKLPRARPASTASARSRWGSRSRNPVALARPSTSRSEQTRKRLTPSRSSSSQSETNVLG